jgi:uncharacterized membrane protein YkoI
VKLRMLFTLLLLLALACGQTQDAASTISSDSNDTVKDDSTVIPDADGDGDGTNLSDAIDPANFVSEINNPYFSLIPGRKYYFEGIDSEGHKIKKQLLASDKTRQVLGVSTQALWERRWVDDLLSKDEKHWYAQDKDGNVWLFAEDAVNLFDGFLQSPGESWVAGENNAKAGIVVPANPTVGATFTNAFDGTNTDSSEILAVNEKVSVPSDSFNDCLKIKESSLDANSTTTIETNYYCKNVANLAKETTDSSGERVHLMHFDDGNSTQIDIKYPPLQLTVTEENAKKIAFEKINEAKTITDSKLSVYKDKPAYEVAITDKSKDEWLVWVDAATGRVMDSKKQ